MDHAATVEDVVRRFYSAGANEAHSWLLQVQASPEAWTFVWELLDPSKTWEVQFFAASTLHAKITKQWDEVPKNEYTALKDRILNCMQQGTAPKLVLFRLCQTLAAFLAHSHAADDEAKERNLVEELIATLPCDTPSTLDLLLRVLTALPGEFERRQGARRTKIRESLAGNWSRVTQLLLDVFSTCEQPIAGGDSDALYLLGLECCLSWLKMGQLPLETTSLLYPQLLSAATRYASCREDADEESARGWEVVQECLIMAVTHSELRKRPQLLWEWAGGFVWVAHQQGGRPFYETLTVLGEAHSRAFLLALAGEGDERQKWISETLIGLLLECSELEGRYPIDEMSSCIPFGFWYALQDDLATLDQPLEARASLALKPIYARLTQALLRKATLPPSSSAGGDADDRELLRCYRQDAADTLTYSYNVLGGELLLLLGQRLSQLHGNLESWTDVESTLHAFKALSECVGTQETHYVPALIDLVLLHIPYAHYPGEVLASACSAMGAYAEWIGEHPDPWLEGALQLIGLGLAQGSVTAPSASMALKDLARECGPHLAPLAPAILDTIGRTLPLVSPGGGEGLRLMFAAGKLLNSLRSTDQQLQYLDTTMGPCVARLRELLQHPASTARTAVANQIKMATTLFSTLEGTSGGSVGKAVLDGLLPLFSQIISDPEWGTDDTTLEAMHACAQRSLLSLPQPEMDSRPLLPILAASYKTRPHPAALQLLRQLVLLFGKDTGNVVTPVFAELSSHTLGGVKACQAVGGNLSDLADLLEAYLTLLAQICKKNARMLLQVPEQVPEMLRCGNACLAVPESGTTKAAGSFLSHAITQSPHLQTFIQPIGQELVCMILRCVGGEVARNNLEPHAEVLLALNKACSEWTAQWLRQTLAEATAPALTQAQRDEFARAVLRERTSKRRLHETLKEFSLVCRQGMW